MSLLRILSTKVSDTELDKIALMINSEKKNLVYKNKYDNEIYLYGILDVPEKCSKKRWNNYFNDLINELSVYYEIKYDSFNFNLRKIRKEPFFESVSEQDFVLRNHVLTYDFKINEENLNKLVEKSHNLVELTDDE